MNTDDRPYGQPFARAQGSSMRKMGDVPENDILFLDPLIILTVAQLPSGTEYPREILPGTGSPDRNIMR